MTVGQDINQDLRALAKGCSTIVLVIASHDLDIGGSTLPG